MVAAARVLQIISVCSPSLVCHGCLGCYNFLRDVPKVQILKEILAISKAFETASNKRGVI